MKNQGEIEPTDRQTAIILGLVPDVLVESCDVRRWIDVIATRTGIRSGIVAIVITEAVNAALGEEVLEWSVVRQK